MKLMLDVKSIQYNQRPESALYDPKKTSSTEKAITWTINSTASEFCVSDISGGFGSTQDENDFPTKK